MTETQRDLIVRARKWCQAHARQRYGDRGLRLMMEDADRIIGELVGELVGCASVSNERSESSGSLPSAAQKHADAHVCATWQTPGCHDSDRGWCHHFILDEHVCDCGITTLPSAVPEQANGSMEQPDE